MQDDCKVSKTKKVVAGDGPIKGATSQVTVKRKERKMLVSKCTHCGSYNAHDCGIEASCINRLSRARAACNEGGLCTVDFQGNPYVDYCKANRIGTQTTRTNGNKTKYSFGPRVIAEFPMTRKGSAKAKIMVDRMNQHQRAHVEQTGRYRTNLPLDRERRQACDASTTSGRWIGEGVPKPIELGDTFRQECS